MKVQAVIFDLFGTLVFDKFSGEKYTQFLSRQASALKLDISQFAALWKNSFSERTIGKFETLEHNLNWIGKQLGRTLNPVSVEEVASQMVDLTRQALTPRSQALEVLFQLRLKGIKTGLMSDCGPAVPLVWNETPFPTLFDAVAFSCKEGIRKPDPAFYQVLVDRLGVPASQCLYIGDGHSDELAGAKKMGMKAVQVWSAIDTNEPDRLVVKDWDGITLKSLSEVLVLLGT
jgi:putative hydrolase of the HAD superfamily